MAKDSTAWLLEHETFSVLTRCTDRWPGDAIERMRSLNPSAYLDGLEDDRFGWCLYAIIRPGCPFWVVASIPKEEYGMEHGIPEIEYCMHGGTTYLDRKADEVVIGCDYSHAGDDRYMRTPPTDESCAVHTHAKKLEEMLQLAVDASTSEPEQWPFLVAAYQEEYPTLVGHLAQKLAL